MAATVTAQYVSRNVAVTKYFTKQGFIFDLDRLWKEEDFIPYWSECPPV